MVPKLRKLDAGLPLFAGYNISTPLKQALSRQPESLFSESLPRALNTTGARAFDAVIGTCCRPLRIYRTQRRR